MITTIYTPPRPGETQEEAEKVTLNEAITQTTRISDLIVQLASYLNLARATMDAAGIASRIPGPDTDAILDALGTLADLRDEMECRLGMIEYRERAKSPDQH